MATEIQMITKPTQRIGVSCSSTTNTAHNICIVGVIYCNIPTVDRGISLAPRPNSSSGTAVTRPALISSAVCPAPKPVNVLWCWVVRNTRYSSAIGKSTIVSAARLAAAEMFTRFLIRP